MARPISDRMLENGRRELVYDLAHGSVTAVDRVVIGAVDLEPGPDVEITPVGTDRGVTMVRVEVAPARLGPDVRLTSASYRMAPERAVQAAVAAGQPVRAASYRRG